MICSIRTCFNPKSSVCVTERCWMLDFLSIWLCSLAEGYYYGTHTISHTHTVTHTNTQSLTHAHTVTHTYTHTQSLSHNQSHTHTHKRSAEHASELHTH